MITSTPYRRGTVGRGLPAKQIISLNPFVSLSGTFLGPITGVSVRPTVFSVFVLTAPLWARGRPRIGTVPKGTDAQRG